MPSAGERGWLRGSGSCGPDILGPAEEASWLGSRQRLLTINLKYGEAVNQGVELVNKIYFVLPLWKYTFIMTKSKHM